MSRRPSRPASFVRMFPEFALLVASGAKCQTVRPIPRRMPRPGDKDQAVMDALPTKFWKALNEQAHGQASAEKPFNGRGA